MISLDEKDFNTRSTPILFFTKTNKLIRILIRILTRINIRVYDLNLLYP